MAQSLSPVLLPRPSGGGGRSSGLTVGGQAIIQPTQRIRTSSTPGQGKPGAAPAPASSALPSLPQNTPTAGGAASGGSSAPAEITQLEIKGEVDPRLNRYADAYDTHLSNLEQGKTREADVMRGQLDSDMERQIQQARETTLASGGTWTAKDEERMRSELRRGQYGAMAQFELGSQRQATEARIGGLGIAKAPFESQMAEKGLSAQTQKMLMDYAIQRGGLMSEDKRTAVMEAGQAMDAYRAFLQTLQSPAFNFSASYS